MRPDSTHSNPSCEQDENSILSFPTEQNADDTLDLSEVFIHKMFANERTEPVASAKPASTQTTKTSQGNSSKNSDRTLNGHQLFPESNFDDLVHFEDAFCSATFKKYSYELLTNTSPKTSSTVISRDWLHEFKLLPQPGIRKSTLESIIESAHIEVWPSIPDESDEQVEFVLIKDVDPEPDPFEIEFKTWCARKSAIDYCEENRIEPRSGINTNSNGTSNFHQNGQSTKRKHQNGLEDFHSLHNDVSSNFKMFKPLPLDVSTLESSNTIHAFKKGGVTTRCGSQLKLYHVREPTSYFSCLSCPDQDVKFNRLNHLAKHIEMTHNPSNLICLFCKPDVAGFSPKFRTSDEAFVHYIEVHYKDPKYFLCEFCQLLVQGLSTLEAHLIEFHPDEEFPDTPASMKRFPCLLCLFPFKQSGHRKDHFKSNHSMNVNIPVERKVKGPKSAWQFMSPCAKPKPTSLSGSHLSNTGGHSRLQSTPFSTKKKYVKLTDEEKEKRKEERRMKRLLGQDKREKVPEEIVHVPAQPQVQPPSQPPAQPPAQPLVQPLAQPVPNQTPFPEISKPKSVSNGPAENAQEKVVEPPPRKPFVQNRNMLRRDLKDKYADILSQQPVVRLLKVFKNEPSQIEIQNFVKQQGSFVVPILRRKKR